MMLPLVCARATWNNVFGRRRGRGEGSEVRGTSVQVVPVTRTPASLARLYYRHRTRTSRVVINRPSCCELTCSTVEGKSQTSDELRLGERATTDFENRAHPTAPVTSIPTRLLNSCATVIDATRYPNENPSYRSAFPYHLCILPRLFVPCFCSFLALHVAKK